MQRLTALGETFRNGFQDRGSIPLISTKAVSDEHLLFQRRICLESNALIPITKAPFREIEAVLLYAIAHFRFCILYGTMVLAKEVVSEEY